MRDANSRRLCTAGALKTAAPNTKRSRLLNFGTGWHSTSCDDELRGDEILSKFQKPRTLAGEYSSLAVMELASPTGGLTDPSRGLYKILVPGERTSFSSEVSRGKTCPPCGGRSLKSTF